MHHGVANWREWLARCALVCFCVGFSHKALFYPAVVMLVLAWLVDGGMASFKQLLREPLVRAVLILGCLLLLGLLWSETPLDGRHKWIKYLLLLLYLPFLALLNKKRLPWAAIGLLVGVGLVVFIGAYQWAVDSEQGVPALGLSYLNFSALLGIGIVLSGYLACSCRNSLMRVTLLVSGLALLYLQFQQGARGFLLVTLFTLLIMVINYFRVNMRRFVALSLVLIALVGLFTYTSPVMQDRWGQAQQDFAKLQQADFRSSIGYRLAMWDIGLHGVLQQPWWGHGTGSPEQYVNQTIQHYKNGIYKDLPDFQPYAHFHNDWIEIGMHVGLLGIFALMYLLWVWYETFKRCGIALLGVGMVSFIFLSGLTEAFMIFYRIPVLLLMITGITVVHCRKENNLE